MDKIIKLTRKERLLMWGILSSAQHRCESILNSYSIANQYKHGDLLDYKTIGILFEKIGDENMSNHMEKKYIEYEAKIKE